MGVVLGLCTAFELTVAFLATISKTPSLKPLRPVRKALPKAPYVESCMLRMLGTNYAAGYCK